MINMLEERPSVWVSRGGSLSLKPRQEDSYNYPSWYVQLASKVHTEHRQDARLIKKKGTFIVHNVWKSNGNHCISEHRACFLSTAPKTVRTPSM
jgi:hypothetical protein